MDMEGWAELARLAREAKAELEKSEPGALADISTCDDVVVVAEAMLAGGRWTSDPEVLAEWLDAAKTVAVEVRNGHDPEEWTYLPLGGVDEARTILRSWLTTTPKRLRREVQVECGAAGVEADTACVTVRERWAQVVDTAEAHGAAEAPEPGG